MLNLNAKEWMQMAMKYVLEGLAVALAAFYIPSKGKMKPREVLMIGATAAGTFLILDMFAPSIAMGARTGAGFGIGARSVGFLRK